jgi:hypothetical protein
MHSSASIVFYTANAPVHMLGIMLLMSHCDWYTTHCRASLLFDFLIFMMVFHTDSIQDACNTRCNFIVAGRLPALGEDVTPHALSPASSAELDVGALVGVLRRDGTVTVGRLDPPYSSTPAGYFHITLSMDGSSKDVPLGQLFSLQRISQVRH